MPKIAIGIALFFLCLTGPVQAQTFEQRLKTAEGQLIELRLMRESLAEQTAAITRLQEDIARLKGDVEEIRFQIKSMNNSGDLEGRLGKIENRLNTLEGNLALDAQPKKPTVAKKPDPEPAKPKVEKPKPAKRLSEKDAFEQAKELFKQGKMVQAREAMNGFINEFPASSIVPSARFWIGETFYYEKKYEEAILEYQKVIHDFPKSGKVPSALLKQAFAFAELKDSTSAQLILRRLIKEYSESPQAIIAKKKLNTLN